MATYSFNLSIYELASECALASGNLSSLQSLLNEATQKAQRFEDTLTIQFIHMTLLAYSSQMAEALKIGLAVVSKLGVDLPNNQEEVNQQLSLTISMLQDMPDVNVLATKLMSNDKMLIATKYLGRLQIISFMVVAPEFVPLLLKMVQLTLTYGKFNSVYNPI